jgi:hypothetical protein
MYWLLVGTQWTPNFTRRMLLSYWHVALAGFCSGVSYSERRCQSCDESIALCEVATLLRGDCCVGVEACGEV